MVTISSIFIEIYNRHERLKKVISKFNYGTYINCCFIFQKIHSFRLPLSPTGQKIMGFVYFSIPCILGYYIYGYTTNLAYKKFWESKANMVRPSEETRMQNMALQRILDKCKAS